DSATTITVTAGATSTANITLTAGGKISGTITSPAGLALPDQVSFSLYRDGSYYYGGSSSYAPSTGTFTLAGLPAGSYTLQYSFYGASADAPSFLAGWYGGTSQDSATTITVTAGATSTANITLTAGGKISGTITSPAGLALPDQMSFSLSRDGSYYYGSTDYDHSTGAYAITGLPAGSYKLQYYPYSYGASADAPSYVAGWYGGTSQDSATTITVTAGATSTANITLTAGGKISGTITAPAGLALPDQVSFSLYRDGSYYYGSTDYDHSTGAYAITGLPAGSYKLQYYPYSYSSSAPSYFSGWYGGAGQATATTVTVTAGGNTIVNLSLESAATISGTVIAPSGTTLPSRLWIDVYQGDDWVASGSYDRATGTYAVNELRAGTYAIHYRAPLSSPFVDGWLGGETQENATPIVVASGAAVTADLTLIRSASISGIVTDGTAPVAGARVDAFLSYWDGDDHWYSSRHVTTAADGSYSLAGLSTGDYKVRFTKTSQNLVAQWWNDQPTLAAANVVSVTTGSDASGYDAALHPGGTIAGTVSVPAGNALPDSIRIEVYRDGALVSDDVDYDSASGAFSAPGLPAGSYTLRFTPPNTSDYVAGWHGGTSASDATAINVTTGAVTRVDIDLVVGASVSGTLSVPAGVAWPSWVDLQVSRDGDYVAGVTVYPSAEDHRFAIRGLPAGTYTISYSVPSRSGLLSGWIGGTSEDDPEQIIVALGDTVTRDIALQRGGIISGTVTTGSAPVAGARVAAYPKLRDGSYASWASSAAKTDSAGHYSILGLSTNDYKVRFAKTSQNLVAEWWDDKPTEDTANPVSVVAGSERATISAALATVATDNGGDAGGGNNGGDAGGGNNDNGGNGNSGGNSGGGGNGGGTDNAGQAPPASFVLGHPTVSGSPDVGARLTAHPGTWSPVPQLVSYQWLVDGRPLPGSVSPSLTVPKSAAGKHVSVVVTAAAAGYTTATATSPVITIHKVIAKSPKPKTTTTGRVGAAIAVKAMKWPAKTKVSYQWYRNGKPIKKATKAKYTITKADRGKKITLRVTGRKPGYTSVTKIVVAVKKVR
ncbi:carboxypeptidase-like regulatory domain-containing protein, partial [Galbitalea sp. SE-J8]|uniref:carboxypeptidase-like regulatory domain-containing protein n=1 Tax=Galbitalea sp. SE-J8 TaxID=3054952 RepID=UPI00259CAF30